MTQGERIKQARKSTGKTAPELAKDIGISKQAYYNWEHDVVGFIKPRHMAKFCALTGYSETWIKTGKGPEKQAGMDETWFEIAELWPTMNDEARRQVVEFARFKIAS